MRVGILLNSANPKDGGGYTFEDEIFKSVLSNIDFTNHEIIILSVRDLDISFVSSKVQFYSLKNRKRDSRSWSKIT